MGELALRNDEFAPAGMPDYLAERLEVHGLIDGIHWAITRAPMYGFNGYACIPEEHPWRDREYDDLDFDVHGGLTFGAADTNGWVGFDCHHAWDYWGAAEDDYYQDLGLRSTRMHGSQLWTKELVIEEAKRLASQVAASRHLPGVVEGEVIESDRNLSPRELG